MSPTEIITAVKDIVLATAAASTAVVAILGLKGWSRELKGKAQFEVARGLAKATYKLRDEIALCRQPLIRADEFPEGYSPSPKNTAEDQASAYAHVFMKRWSPVATALQDFDAQTLEAEALWGESLRSKTSQLRSTANTLHAAIEAYLSNHASGGKDFDADAEFSKKIRREVFALKAPTENPLSQAIGSAIKSIEDELRPHLRRA